MLKEIILHQKITLEEIINFICLNNETTKHIKENENKVSSRTLLSSNKFFLEIEKLEHKEHILNYKVNSIGELSRRPLTINNNCSILIN